MSDDQQDPRYFVPPDPSSADEGPDFLLEGPDSTASGAPLESGPQPPAEEPSRSDLEAYASELRENLLRQAGETSGQPSGGLISRITGSLRRVTAPLRGTGKLREETGQPAAEGQPPEIGDDFLSGRLGGAAAVEPASGEIIPFEKSIAPAENAGAEIIPVGPNIPMFDSDDFGTPGTAEDDWLDVETPPATVLGGDGPALYPESGETDDQDLAHQEEAAHQEKEQQPGDMDWMAQIRAETARAETSEGQPGRDKSAARSASGPLLDFIDSILRRGEPRQEQAGAAETEAEVPEELITSRLAGLDSAEIPGITAAPAAPAEEASDLDAHLSSLFGKDSDLDSLDTFPESEPGLSVEQGPSAGVVEDTLFDNLEARFGLEDEVGPAEAPLDSAGEEVNPYRFFPEDEKLLWEETPTAPADEAPLAPDTLWGEEPEVKPYEPDRPPMELRPADFEPPRLSPSDLAQEVWGEAEEQPPRPRKQPTDRLNKDDAYAAAYLTGEEYVPGEDAGPAPDYLLREALEKSGQTEDMISVEDMRAIIFEDAQEEDARPAWKAPEREESMPASRLETVVQPETTLESDGPLAAPAVVGEQAVPHLAEAQTAEEEEEVLQPEPSGDWRAWLAARSLFQRILLLEAAVAVLAMLVAVPFFLFLIARGPAQGSSAALAPRPLPADVPYPTGLTLPGGWDFPLEKSTFVAGHWQPATSEWLEGSELRRVVALPWNPQTEAVIQTFKIGDRVELSLSNGDTLRYKVTEIRRVPVNDPQVYYDTKPSLAIILYQEKAAQRWVVICKP